jgi:hypothetical protein
LVLKRFHQSLLHDSRGLPGEKICLASQKPEERGKEPIDTLPLLLRDVQEKWIEPRVFGGGHGFDSKTAQLSFNTIQATVWQALPMSTSKSIVMSPKNGARPASGVVITSRIRPAPPIDWGACKTKLVQCCIGFHLQIEKQKRKSAARKTKPYTKPWPEVAGYFSTSG